MSRAADQAPTCPLCRGHLGAEDLAGFHVTPERVQALREVFRAERVAADRIAAQELAGQPPVPPMGGGGGPPGGFFPPPLPPAGVLPPELPPMTIEAVLGTFRVPLTHSALASPVQELGFSSVVTGRARNPHAWAAVCRTMATVHALSLIGGRAHHVRVLDWYGARRVQALLPQVVMPGRGASVELIAAPDTVHPGDAARDFSNRVPFPLSVLFDAALAIDVYHWTGADFATILGVAPVLYLVVHTFRGVVGVELAPDSASEGVWVRDAQGLINFSPSPNEMAYAPHPACDWMFQRRAFVDGVALEISELRRYGCMALLRVVRAPNNVVCPPIPVDTLTRFAREVLPYGAARRLYYGITNWLVAVTPELVGELLPWGVRDTAMIVDRMLVAQLGPAFSARVKAGWTVDSALAAVQSAALKDPAHMALTTRFPGVAYDLVVGTATSILYSFQSRQATVFHTLRRLGVADENALRAARQPTPWAPAPVRSWWWVVGPLLALLFLSFRASRYVPSSTDLPPADFFYWFDRAFSWGVSSFFRGFSWMSIAFWDCLNWILEWVWFQLNSLAVRAYSQIWALTRFHYFWDTGFIGSAKHLFWYWVDYFGLTVTLVFRLPVIDLHVFFLTHVPLITFAMAEEFLKCRTPLLALAMILVEIGFCGCFLGVEAAVLLVLVHACFWAINVKSMWLAVLAHYVYNCCVMWFSHYAPGRRLLASFLYWVPPVVVVAVILGCLLLIVLCRVRVPHPLEGFLLARQSSSFYTERASIPLPSSFVVPTFRLGFSEIGPQRGSVKLLVGGLERDYLDLASGSNPHLDPYRTPMFPILLTNGILEAPENSVYGFSRALAYRQCYDPHTDLMEVPPGPHWDMAAVRSEWAIITAVLLESVPPVFLPVDPFLESPEAAFAAMGVRGRRLAMAWDLLESTGTHPRRKAIKLKPDETLFYGKAERCVVSFSPDVLALTAPESRAFTSMLKTVWDGVQVFLIAGEAIHLFYASGRVAADLTRMLEHFSVCYNGVLVSGDDTLVRLRGQTLETDVAKCDACLSEGPLVDMDRRIYERVGIPSTLIELLLWGVAAKYDCKARTAGDDYRASVQTPVQNATGTTMTSSGNTVHVATVPIHAMVFRLTIEESARALGMRFKVKYLSTIYEATFLKCLVAPVRTLTSSRGVYFDLVHESTLTLVPQLGLIGKLCKTMTHPSEALRIRDPVLAVRAMAGAIGRSILVKSDYPILGSFLAAMRRCGLTSRELSEGGYEGRLPSPTALIEGGAYKFFSDARDVERADVLPIICARYGFDLDVILDVESMFKAVVSLPWFVSHPAIARIMEVDYS
jgi:hypothetical protein